MSVCNINSILQQEDSFYHKIKSSPDFILNVIRKLSDRDQLSNALSCKMMLVFNAFPLGKCKLSHAERPWIQIIQEELFPEKICDTSRLKLSEIVCGMPVIEFSISSFSSLKSPTSQFLTMDLDPESEEAYLRDSLCRKLFRNKYLDSVIQQIKNGEKKYMSKYFIFYHSCSLSTFIFTEFSKSLIEMATKDENHHLQQIKGLSWFRFPQFVKAEII